MAAGEIVQSIVAPAGVYAASIHRLWLLMLWVSAAVFGILLGLMLAALTRGMRQCRPGALPPTSDHRLSRVIGAGILATLAVLVALLAASVWTGRAVASPHGDPPLGIAIVGHQWWWEVEYEDAQPSRRVLTANELHLPLHRPVVLKVTSRDVIHSFWVPTLQGKRDLIPGMTTVMWLQADRAGRFRGQCAEFCGLQHAHMAFDVVAEPPASFEQWLAQARAPARVPGTSLERQGLAVFTAGRCGRCHTIRGTDAAGQIAPDLTHVASRRTLGAGTLSNTPAHRRAWIADPQAFKPGNQMPASSMGDEAMAALLAYLDTLR